MYKYLFLDAQYLLSRNFFAIKGSSMKDFRRVTLTDGTEVKDEEGHPIKVGFPSFDYRELCRSMYQSVAKLCREYPCEKVFLLFDKSPYHRTQLVKDYKGTRFYATEDELKKINRDEQPVEYFKMQAEVEANNIKTHSKYSINKMFPSLGMPIMLVQGYEADDLAYIAAQSLKDTDERYALVTVDSDWSYRLVPNFDLINPKTGKVTTYEEMKQSISNVTLPVCLASAIHGLYLYHALTDSFKGGHNDLHPTLTSEGKKVEKEGRYDVLNDAIVAGDPEGYFEDLELVKLQIQTFDVNSFEDVATVRELFTPKRLSEIGSILTGEKAQDKLRYFSISEKTYSRFCDTIDRKAYSVI